MPGLWMSDLSAAPATGTERIAAAFHGHGRSAALMPYLMGGFPSLEASREVGRVYAKYADLRAACDAEQVALIPLVAPTTPPKALREIGSSARGFVYVVSVTGVTGERADLPPELRTVVEQVRASASVPAAVGFGIGTPDQAAAVGEIADGVIIGSRLVREVAEAPSLEQGLAGVERFLRETSDALGAR